MEVVLELFVLIKGPFLGFLEFEPNIFERFKRYILGTFTTKLDFYPEDDRFRSRKQNGLDSTQKNWLRDVEVKTGLWPRSENHAKHYYLSQQEFFHLSFHGAGRPSKNLLNLDLTGQQVGGFPILAPCYCKALSPFVCA